MTEVGFYHLLDQPLDDALAQLLEKAHERGMRCVVLTGSAARSEALAGHLWSYSRDNFLPHGTRLDGRADEQPIFITEREENPNGASAVFLVEGGPVEFVGGFERCFDLFDGRDEEAVGAHMQAPHMADLMAALGTAKIEAISINAYEAHFLKTLLGGGGSG